MLRNWYATPTSVFTIGCRADQATRSPAVQLSYGDCVSTLIYPSPEASGLGFGSVRRRVPFNGSPAPALPHRPATRPHATALTPPQPSWMRSSAPLSAHCTMRSRCAAVTSHGAVTYKHSSARRTGSQLQATAVSGATPPCPATCLTSRARTQLPDKSACGSLALPHAATANPFTPCPTRTSRRQHGTHSARRRIPPGRPSRLYPAAHLHSSQRAGPQRPSIQRPKKPIFLLCSSTSGVVSRSAVQLADEPRLW